MNDPFTLLGLPARRDLTDEDVRAAWRRIAAVTHPDLADGGDPARYSAAAAAYETLRTAFGRGEALADRGLAGPLGSARAPRHGRRTVVAAGIVTPAAIVIAVAIAAVAIAAAVAVAVVGWSPASIALVAGAATWLVTGWGRWRRGGPGR